jgi:hypothetical protein
MQLDEATDISQCVCVCYVHADAIKEKFLVCDSLLETTKAFDTLEMVKRFLQNKTLTGKKSFILLRCLVTHLVLLL